MKIAEASKRYDITTDTLRYYERVGVLRNVPRTDTGIRHYSEENCSDIEFIKNMREAGMSIEALVDYMELVHMGDAADDQRRDMLQDQRRIISDRIADLERALTCIDEKLAAI